MYMTFYTIYFSNHSSENDGDFDAGEVLGLQDHSTILESGSTVPSEVDISCSTIISQGQEDVKIDAKTDNTEKLARTCSGSGGSALLSESTFSGERASSSFGEGSNGSL
mmetsp:Transcript_12590/g.21296  ORF Transcript_12590/g.21296 Transcript_12590/m.21296 type:complete len:109 (+) Transcript_12590:323-649(+)